MKAGKFRSSICGVQVPRVIYGTAWKKAQTQGLVTKAIQQGFRGIDTACQPRHYNEAGAGAGVIESLGTGLTRADLYLQTKFTPVSGQDPDQIPYDPAAQPAEQVAQSFQASLRNLQTGYLDCLVLHSPIADKTRAKQVWQAMEKIFDAAGARQLGISNCYSLEYLEALCDSMRVKPAVVQNRFYPETGYDREIREFCRRHGIIYQSFWTLTANPHVLAHETVHTLVGKYERTAAQILFRYLTQEDLVVLTGTKHPTHMREDLEIFDFELTRNERDSMRKLF